MKNNRTDIAIDVAHISKGFKIYYDRGHTLKELTIFRSRNRHEIKQVLDDISFTVDCGEAVALIGHNGCGKSTTLKLLTRIMYPDTGEIMMRGRVASLIELGAGFHPDMSGRENIYINASIFGLTHKEIDERLNSIITFSELEGYIDNPVRTYSSGMYMRLAFSVAVNVSADILLIDEILAVGDAGFQAKCFNKMRKIKKEGTTIVLVSHSMSQVEKLCDRSIWINDGKVVMDGPCKEVDDAYLAFVDEDSEKRFVEEVKNEISRGILQINGEVSLDSMQAVELESIETADGFYDRELSDIDDTTFVWMGEKEATISFSNEIAKKDIVLRIPYHVTSRLDKPMRLSAKVNGREVIQDAELSPDGSLLVPLSATSTKIALSIAVSELWRPVDVLGTVDARLLGVQLDISGIFSIGATVLPDMGVVVSTS